MYFMYVIKMIVIKMICNYINYNFIIVIEYIFNYICVLI